MTPALAPQLGLLGSPSDPVGRFTMREGPSPAIVIDSPMSLSEDGVPDGGFGHLPLVIASCDFRMQ